jgi:acyl dehydratase
MLMKPIKFYWEDFIPGWQHESNSKMLTSREIIAFAREYDPQSYHTDEEAAKSSFFGGLIASGWHTCCIAMRLMCDDYLLETSCIGSPGLDELRWFIPVRPGDILRLRSTVLDQTPSQKDPTRGTVKFRWEVLNQKDEVACAMTGRQLYRRRAQAIDSEQGINMNFHQ